MDVFDRINRVNLLLRIKKLQTATNMKIYIVDTRPAFPLYVFPIFEQFDWLKLKVRIVQIICIIFLDKYVQLWSVEFHKFISDISLVDYILLC
jgi:hypothetical protein